MILDSISILNYKNLEQCELEISPKLNCFVGQNGVGKTNILDAIYYLSFCKSAFNPIDSQNIRHGEDYLMLQGVYHNDDGQEETIYCGLKQHHRKVFKRNDKAYSKLSEHIGRVPLVLVSPNDSALILGHSEERRKFLDMIISQYDVNYLSEIIRYNKALEQRNALLRSEGPVDADFFAVYEDVMADAGQKIYESRYSFVEKFCPIFQKFYSRLSEDHERVGLKYISACQQGNLRELILSSRQKDQIVGFSLCGVHRDDLEMTLDGFPIRKEGSQGQNKTFLISLKLAQFEYLKEHQKRVPILLLDDIFDKLDSSRVAHILRLVSEDTFGQIFITDTDRDFLRPLIKETKQNYKLFEVAGGHVTYEEE